MSIGTKIYFCKGSSSTVVTNEVFHFYNKKQIGSDPFFVEVKKYVDLHFTQEDRCYATLTEHFQCSTSKLQKAFSKENGISLSAYVENKRTFGHAPTRK